ncbi:MAG: DUF1329 domain-containing protein [Nevskiales bacterium]
MYRFNSALGLAALLLAIPSTLPAKPAPDEIAKLGRELTAIGALRAANADRSIPEWTGPSNFTDEQRKLTPRQIETMPGDELEKLFSGGRIEKPLFTITKANMAQYADKLTGGHKRMLERHPGYKMPVYTSIRSAYFPKAIEDATIRNAETAILDDTGVKNAALGFPFPLPTRPEEIIWNHRMKFRGAAVRRYNNQAIVQPNGDYLVTKLIEDVKFVYSNLRQPAPAGNTVMLHYLSEYLSPPRIAGQYILATEPVQGLREAYIYNPQIRRVRRVPDAGYDNPTEGSDNSQTYDQIDMFNGSLERYHWKLVGKKDMYIPYNSFRLEDRRVKYKDILQQGHINQDLTRYELHRVWVIEANVREGTAHIFKKRVFYVDEDSWSIAVVDCYDNRDQYWRFQEGHLASFPMIPTVSAVPEIIYDLQTGHYFITAMQNEDKVSDYLIEYKNEHFTTQTLKSRISR